MRAKKEKELPFCPNLPQNLDEMDEVQADAMLAWYEAHTVPELRQYQRLVRQQLRDAHVQVREGRGEEGRLRRAMRNLQIVDGFLADAICMVHFGERSEMRFMGFRPKTTK